jgi:raffinose/stachyose/melibiose transport system permease protein
MFGAGMPEDRGWLTGTYMYDQTFNKANIDYGSTIAVLIVVLGVVLSNVSKALFRQTDDY